MFKVVSETQAIDDETVTKVVLFNGARAIHANIYSEDGRWWWQMDTPAWVGGGLKSVDACIGEMKKKLADATRQGWV